jgi:CheY-like chemotaxis protein
MEMMPTALIVEDEPEANKLLSLLVQLRGYRTVSAYTGGEALEQVEAGHPDVVFLDLMLPDTNGFDVCRRIKSRRGTSMIPVVMVTARLAAENRAQSFRVGANEYVPKPYTPDQIFAALRAADCWRREIEEHPDRGAIEVETGHETGPFAGVTRLWSVLLARTDWDESEIRQFGLALLELGQEALEWGHRHGVAHVATFTYEIESDRVRVVVRAEPGWLQSIGRDDKTLFPLEHFDAVSTCNGDPVLTLVRRFRRSGQSGSS